MEPTVITKGRHTNPTLVLLTVSNMAALAASAGLVLVLNPEDRVANNLLQAGKFKSCVTFGTLIIIICIMISIKRGSALTALGFVYFMTLFELMNMGLLYTGAGSRWMRKYRLNTGDVLDINNKLVSAVQAAFCCLTGAVVCAWSCTRDFMKSSHYMSEAYAWFGAAYFFYDIWSMYVVHIHMHSPGSFKSKIAQKLAKNGDPPLASGDGDAKKPPGTTFLAYCMHEPVILFHHLFIGGFGFLVIVYFRGGLGDCVFGFVYLMELSTPFVSLRGILSRLKLKSSTAYVVNGLVMLVTFFVCRVASLPYVCLMYSRAVGLPYWQAISILPTGCKISICILLLPQIYWFYLMSAGAVKVFLGGAKGEVRGQKGVEGKEGGAVAAGDGGKKRS